MDGIVSKIKTYIDNNQLTASAVERSIGVSNGTLSKALKKGTSINTATLEKFLNTYKDFKLTDNYNDDFSIDRNFNDESLSLNEKSDNKKLKLAHSINDDTFKLNLLKEIFGFDNGKLDLILSNQEKILGLLDRQFIKDNIKRIREEIINEEKSENFKEH
ncbi:hypothetical protein [Winogradskyella luteola]|uniref:Uncharacterized protein n=1 Tax=Winogradskyella luteola TaxID=2828330 RepID=A0A9X1F6S1_9FLAO|nr:hypothetical protein [Winogradskyella luteola]MBV7268410.1 hypothetical protein [Winogradskyella luteola]